MSAFFNRITGIVTLLILVVGLSACENSVKDEEDHLEPGGLILQESSGSKSRLLTVWKGKIVSGNLTIKDSTESDHIEIFFLAEDDSAKQFQPTDPDYALEWPAQVADPTIAVLERHDHGLAKTGSEEWEFVLKGIKVGATTVVLRLKHGEHADFNTPPIPITVTP